MSEVETPLDIVTGRYRPYLRPLLERIRKGEIDPSFIITHTIRLDDTPHGYDIFKNKQEDCVKVMLKP